MVQDALQLVHSQTAKKQVSFEFIFDFIIFSTLPLRFVNKDYHIDVDKDDVTSGCTLFQVFADNYN